MNYSISEIIEAVEEEWLNDLTEFIESHFKKVFLPSHDQSHHIRTWEIAKWLIHHISELNSCIDETFVEACLLATMFHDTGMVQTRDPRHGSIGKSVYLKYIKEKEKQPLLHKEIARAIDLHDRKSQDIHIPFALDNTPDLTTFTSIADDLDALGTIGIYRYSEIYLHRGVKLQSLGKKILQNVAIRYNHFAKASILYPAISKKTKASYQEIISFFDQYNQQLLSVEDPEIVYSGHLGVVNYIRNFSVEGTIEPSEFLNSLNNFQVGKFVREFFNKLKNECTNCFS